MDATEFLLAKSKRTNEALRRYLESWRGVPETLTQAMEYSLFAGGKRLRPALALGACELLTGDDADALPVGCAIEMIHTFSLVHDDLPAMDDDDLRRGKPTSHKVYGEAVAILAGDALLTMAFDVAGQCGDCGVVREIAQAAGVAGMVGGQVIDLESEGKTLTIEELTRLHAAKTGALIRVSARAGAMVANASPEQLDALTRYGEHIGLAFQIADDILDVTGSEEQLGKPIGSDAAKNKATYPALLGLDRSRELGQEAVDAAISALAPFGQEAGTFRALARFIIERNQ